jgi:polyvinyl alcohol dehydrogenase (cytochrome)
MPDNGGRTDQYSSGAVWQPPAIDPKRGTLFIGTGNNYTVPADVVACQKANPTANALRQTTSSTRLSDWI